MARKKDNDVETVDTEANGQGRIPGTEIKVIKSIIDLVKQNDATKARHAIETDNLIAENDHAMKLFHKYEEHFTKLEDGSFIYRAAGVELKIPAASAVRPKMKMLETASEE